MNFALLLLIAVVCTTVHSFVITPARMRTPVMRSLQMSDEAEPVVSEPEMELEDKKMFDMNRRVRLGRSRDQDGKSNIWSIEPSMQVEEAEEGSGTKTNLIIGGAVIGAAIAALPLFNAFSTLFPDPADF